MLPAWLVTLPQHFVPAGPALMLFALEADVFSLFTGLRNVDGTFVFAFNLFPILESEDSFRLLPRRVTPEARFRPLPYFSANG